MHASRDFRGHDPTHATDGSLTVVGSLPERAAINQSSIERASKGLTVRNVESLRHVSWRKTQKRESLASAFQLPNRSRCNFKPFCIANLLNVD